VFVVLPDTHVLCGKDAIAWEDLWDETFILGQSATGLAIHDHFVRQLRRPIDCQWSARVRWCATRSFIWWARKGDQSDERSHHRHAFPHVAFRPIAGNSDALPFSGVWLLRNSNQAVCRFISLARTLSKTWNQTDKSTAAASGGR
jgi:hypothetical protein